MRSMGKKRRGTARPRDPSRAATRKADSPSPPPGRLRRLLPPLVGLVALAVLALVWMRRSRPPNLLLVTIDTLRADHVGVYGDADARTPTLDALAHRGVRFAEVESAVPLTGPSHATILTGLYPPVHGVRDNVAFRLGTAHPTLATILHKAGYETGAFVGAFPVASGFGFGQGFDHFSEEFHPSPSGGAGAERPADEVAAAALPWLTRDRRKPFFAWVHFYDPHDPYTPPPPFRERFAEHPYDGEVAFADSELGRILDGLSAKGRLASTLVVVLSDHGEGLGDHGETNHAVLVYQSTLRVPWILAGPGVPEGRVVGSRVGTVDVLPTLLSLLGVGPPRGLPGRDLSAAWRGGVLPPRPLYAESLFGRLNCRWAPLRSWIDGDEKLIDGAAPELYDLARDAAEQHDLAAAEPDRVARMREALRRELFRMAPAGDSARAATLSPDQEARLRSLGYVSGGSAATLDVPGLPDPRTHVRLYERLERLSLVRGPRLREAIPEAASIAAADPGNPFAHFTLARLAYRRGALTLAAREYAATLELDPDRPALREPYGKLLREMGRLRESERQLRIALGQTTPDDLTTRISLAETLILEGQLEEAARLIDGALAAEPHHSEALRAQGHLLLARGDPQAAVASFEKAAANRRDPEPWIELARARLEAGDADAAIQAADAALARNPYHPWAQATKGRALLRDGRREEGLNLLERALSEQPRRPEVWEDLAQGFQDAGDAARAAQCRRRATAHR